MAWQWSEDSRDAEPEDSPYTNVQGASDKQTLLLRKTAQRLADLNC